MGAAEQYHHDKGRSCERTDEVLENYRRRAVEAERRLAELSDRAERYRARVAAALSSEVAEFGRKDGET